MLLASFYSWRDRGNWHKTTRAVPMGEGQHGRATFPPRPLKAPGARPRCPPLPFLPCSCPCGGAQLLLTTHRDSQAGNRNRRSSLWGWKCQESAKKLDAASQCWSLLTAPCLSLCKVLPDLQCQKVGTSLEEKMESPWQGPWCQPSEQHHFPSSSWHLNGCSGKPAPSCAYLRI